MTSGGGPADRHLPKLREAFARPGGAVVFAGAGVSIQTTGGGNAASWRGLLVEGLQRCINERGAGKDFERAVGGLIETGHLAHAGDLITKRLGGRESAPYAEWLRDTVGSLRATSPALLDAMATLRQPVVTTNYDDLVASALRLPVVTWDESAKLHDFFRDGPERYEAVLHLHGHWRSPRSIVLDLESYEDVRRDRVAQNGLRAWLTTRTAVFVGFGGGLDDPNFSALRVWLAEVLGDSPHAHYALVRDPDLEGARRLLDDGGRIVPIGFGPTWGDLPRFLAGLASGTTSLPTNVAGGVPPSTRPNVTPESELPARDRQPSRLETLYSHRDELRATGAPAGDVEQLERSIRDLKRSLREGPMPSPGDVFGERYVLERRLDAGGFGHVWRAWDRVEGRPVALKFLHGVHLGDQSRVERFFRGAAKQASLDHPNVVRVLDPEGRDGDWRYFAMELVPGTDLRRAVLERTLDRTQILRVLGEIAEALEHAWQAQGLVHRDVKPANVLVDEQGRARLTDFDLVRAPASTQATLPGQAMGSVGFSAPEVIEGGETTRKSDVWSYAMTALWALSGGRAQRSGAKELDGALRRTGLPRPARKALRECLSEDPGPRLESPMALYRSLTQRPTPRPAPGSVLAVGLVAVLAAYLWWSRDAGPREAEPRTAATAPATYQAPTEPQDSVEQPPSGAPGKGSSPDPAPTAGLPSPNDADRAQRMAAEDELDLRGLTFVGFNQQGRPEYALDKDPSVVLVHVPPGSYVMGASRDASHPRYDEQAYEVEEPPHGVRVPGFLLSRYELTNDQYGRFLKAKAHRAPEYWSDSSYNRPDQPVVGITWDDVKEYCKWAELGLPSEAEWEYACRGGMQTRYWSGKEEQHLADVGWYSGNSGPNLHPVAERRAPNPFGLFDVHGNVFEWCEDHWSSNYLQSQWVHPKPYEAEGAEDRVIRGGSFAYPARNARSACRFYAFPEYRSTDLGFRPARGITTE